MDRPHDWIVCDTLRQLDDIFGLTEDQRRAVDEHLVPMGWARTVPAKPAKPSKIKVPAKPAAKVPKPSKSAAKVPKPSKIKTSAPKKKVRSDKEKLAKKIKKMKELYASME